MGTWAIVRLSLFIFKLPANDRAARCLWPSSCCTSEFPPENPWIAVRTISAVLNFNAFIYRDLEESPSEKYLKGFRMCARFCPRTLMVWVLPLYVEGLQLPTGGKPWEVGSGQKNESGERTQFAITSLKSTKKKKRSWISIITDSCLLLLCLRKQRKKKKNFPCLTLGLGTRQ